jgi:hypothetical protein
MTQRRPEPAATGSTLTSWTARERDLPGMFTSDGRSTKKSGTTWTKWSLPGSEKEHVMMGMGRWMGVLAGMGLMFLSTEASALEHCEVTGCGSNTPELFGTPIIGLSLRGERNAREASLDPRLERVLPLPWPMTDCPAGSVLGVDHGELVGKSADGTIVCRGCAMLGMAFGVEVDVSTNQGVKRVKVTVRISEASQVSTWEHLPRAPAPSVPTYRLVWHDVSAAAAVLGTTRGITGGDSICPRREAWMEEWQTVFFNASTDTPRKVWMAATDHLMIVQGETYKDDGTIDVARKGNQWFNIACVGTSIAKMRLLGYDPMTGPGFIQGAERQATLKMLTGRYLPGDHNPSYTHAGMPLMWVSNTARGPSRVFNGQPDPEKWKRSVVEAYWGKDGAICVAHRRTWRKKELLRVANDVEAIEKAMPESTTIGARAAVGRDYKLERRSVRNRRESSPLLRGIDSEGCA